MVQLTAVYSPYIILLSFGIAFIGSYMTICLCEHFRLCSFSDSRSKILNKDGLLCLMAFSFGGVAIWGMHFVGMASMSFRNVNGEDVNIQFQIMPTIISLLFVLIFSYLGLYISSNDIVFSKTKTEIVDLFVQNAIELSSRDIKAIPMWRMVYLISTQSFHHLLFGGILASAGVCCMHYLGMWAMSFEGHIIWDVGVIVSSILIALVAATAAFWILFRLLSLYPHLEILRLTSALVMAIAVSGMHYSGMMAARFEYDPNHSVNKDLQVWGKMTPSVAFNYALIVSIVFMFALVILAFTDLRLWLYATSNQLDKAERLLAKIEDNSYNSDISRYFDKKKQIIARGGRGANLNIFGKLFGRAASIATNNDSDDLIYLAFNKLHQQRGGGSSTTSSFGDAGSQLAPSTTSSKRGYSEVRVGPAHEHPSIANALIEFRQKSGLNNNSTQSSVRAGGVLRLEELL